MITGLPEMVGLVRVLLVKVSVVSLSTTCPVASGKVIVLSAVGLVTVKVVSKASAVEPSKVILESFINPPVMVGLVIVGLVRVLFVRV